MWRRAHISKEIYNQGNCGLWSAATDNKQAMNDLTPRHFEFQVFLAKSGEVCSSKIVVLLDM